MVVIIDTLVFATSLCVLSNLGRCLEQEGILPDVWILQTKRRYTYRGIVILKVRHVPGEGVPSIPIRALALGPLECGWAAHY